MALTKYDIFDVTDDKIAEVARDVEGHNPAHALRSLPEDEKRKGDYLVVPSSNVTFLTATPTTTLQITEIDRDDKGDTLEDAAAIDEERDAGEASS